MKYLLQQLLSILVIIASVALAGDVFAAVPSNPLSEITITPTSFSGISNAGQEGYDINLTLSGTSQNTGDTVDSNLGSFTAGSQELTFNIEMPNTMEVFSNGTIRNTLSDDVYIYTQFKVSRTNTTVNPPAVSAILQTYNLIDVIEGGSTVSLVTLDFPGWEIAKYREVNTSGQWYPFVQSAGQITRTPSDGDIYLALKNTTTNEIAILETYPGGSQNLSITWPILGATLLIPGDTYAVYLSDVPDGSLIVATGDSESTYRTLGEVPQASGGSVGDVVTISAISIKERNGKRYYEISGTIDGTMKDTFINANIKTPGTPANVLGPVLGQISYQDQYPFTIPTPVQLDNFPGLEDGNYQLIFSRAGPTGPLYIGDPIPLPPIGGSTGDGTGTGGDVGGTTGGVVYNDTQDDVLKNGIVPTDCGYNLSGKQKDANGNTLEQGSLCGFEDAIRLVRRIIEYIFILVLPIAAIVFAYAGFLFITSGGDTKKRQAAKKAMTSVLIGIIVIMAAWILVQTLVGGLDVRAPFRQFLA